ncbi:MAG: heat-inducible transcriptional repressor HrcA [Clostridia bacterium]
MLDNRKKKILQAIVEEYIETAEPVSSKTLVEKHGIDYSSATIRNDMAELEKIGLIDKPHTSSGRVPSAQGYRYYVDELVNYNNISLQEIKYIQSRLEEKVNQIEDLTKIATSTLSEITHYTSVGIGPRATGQEIEEVKFVLLGARLLMAVILTENGLIKETIIKFDEDINQEQVDTLTYLFNNKLKGKPMTQIDKPMEEYMHSEMSNILKVVKPVLEQIKKVINEDIPVYTEGANKSFEFPEFKSLDVAKNFVNILDTDKTKQMMDILNSGDNQDEINVYIGDENVDKSLKDFSVITFKHKEKGKDLGTIAIIGPTRMDYSKVISAMKYISKKLNEDKEGENSNNLLE